MSASAKTGKVLSQPRISLTILMLVDNEETIEDDDKADEDTDLDHIEVDLPVVPRS